MEINDFLELNALVKLLSKLKFEDNNSVEEYEIFAGSPFISSIYKRAYEDYRKQLLQQGRISKIEPEVFKVDSRIGTVIKRRIDSLKDSTKKTLIERGKVEECLRDFICPLEIDEQELLLLKEYFTKNLD